MRSIHLEKQESAEPLDEVTKAAVEQALAEMQHGEGVTLAQARTIVRKRYKAWRVTQQETIVNA